MKCLLFLFILISQYSSAQTLDWVQPLLTTEYSTVEQIQTDQDGNIYVLGNFFDSVDFDFGTNEYYLYSNNYLDLFIAKYDESGNFIWANKIESASEMYSENFILDGNGNLIIIGTFKINIQFTTETDTITSTAVGNYDYFIGKYDSTGNLIWAKSAGGTSEDWAHSCGTDEMGNVFVTGSFRMTSDFDPGTGTHNLVSSGLMDIFLLKLSPSGNFLWVKKYGSTQYDEGKNIVIKQNEVYLTGYFGGTIDLDPGPQNIIFTSPTNRNPFILKCDTLGNSIWARQYISTGSSQGECLVIDPYGNIYTSGIVQGTMDFDPGVDTVSYTFASNPDFYIIKLDNNGNFIWGYGWGTSQFEFIHDISCDAMGNVYAIGNFNFPIDFNPSNGTNLISPSGSESMFILKISANGTFQFAHKVGQTNITNGSAIKIDYQNDILVGGKFNGMCDFDISSNIFTHTSLDDIANGYFAKYTQNALFLQENEFNFNLNIYPNPTQNILNITQNSNSKLSIEIMNIEGRLIHSFTSSEKNIQKDVSGFANGMYFINVKSETGNAIYKLVKE